MEQPVSFTERTRDFCLYAGIAGMLMSVISIFHYLAAMPEFHWLLILITLPNIGVFISCVFLIKLNRWVVVMLGICVLLFILYFFFVFLMLRYSLIIFSPSSFVLFIFTLAVFLYGVFIDLHSKLKENYENSKADAEYWNGKI